MANIFKTPREIVIEMCADYKNLTGLDLSPDDTNREEIIKMWTYAGAISMMRSDLRRTYDDNFPASSSTEGLIKHLSSRQMSDRIQPQSSTGIVRITGVDGTAIPLNQQIKRKLDGKIYTSIQNGTISGGFVDLSFQSVLTGADQNMDQLDQEFSLVIPVVGADTACFNQTQFLSGRDLETPGEMLGRIQHHDRDDNSGGNLTAYEAFAAAASSQVVTATAIKNPRGIGTVNTVITSGTTDIESAVRNGVPVLRLPSSDLLTIVQNYILSKNPTTDDHLTIAPTETPFNATIKFSLYDETLRTIVASEITKLAQIYIYQARSSQTIYPTELERRIDASVGDLIKQRFVENFSVGSPEYTLGNSSLLVPSTITTTTM